MNTTARTFAVLGATALLATGAGLTASALTTDAAGPATGVTPTVVSTATDVGAQLRLTREEERMARDLYAALAKAHDNALPMSMITGAEQRHFDAVGAMLTRYGVTDPSSGRSAGSYAYPELQKLYDQWYAKGKASSNAAYQVGVELEKWDIAGLQKQVNATSQTDVQRLYTNLLSASQHHLAAYQAAASGQSFGPGAGSGPGAGNGWGGMGSGMGRHMMGGPGGSQGQGFRGDCPMFDTTN
jgi:hypothetical protein